MIHLLRSFTPENMTFNDHVLSARLVPYNEVADVADVLDDGTVDRYREGFEPGAFRRQATTREKGVLARIQLRHLHSRGDGLGYLGQVSKLRDTDDGLYADMPIIPSRAEDVDGLIRNGVDAVSIEFHSPKGGTNERDGIRWRSRAVLWAVSLEPMGAYPGARVLSYRDDGPEPDDDEPEPEPTEPDPPVDEPEPEPVERAALDPEYWEAAAARQRELDARYRPPVVTEEQRRIDSLHDEAVRAYHSR